MKKQKENIWKIDGLKFLAAALLMLLMLNIARADVQVSCSEVIETCDAAILHADIVISELKHEVELQKEVIAVKDEIIENKDIQIQEIANKKDGEKVEVGVFSSMGTALLLLLFVL